MIGWGLGHSAGRLFAIKLLEEERGPPVALSCPSTVPDLLRLASGGGPGCPASVS